MRTKWSQNTKIEDLQIAINEVSAKILCENIGEKVVDGVKTKVCLDDNQEEMADKLNNRIALAPFNTRTRERNSAGKAYSVSQLRYKDNYRSDVSPYKYEMVDWDWWRGKSFEHVYLCADNQNKCNKKSNVRHKEAKRIKHVLGIYRRWDWWEDKYRYYGSNYPDTNDYIDYSNTINDVLNDKFSVMSTSYRVKGVGLYRGYGYPKNTQFYNVPLTNSLKEISKIDKMTADGSTAAYQGILTGVQLLAAGNPNSSDKDEQEAYQSKVKMLLIFSDGAESPHPTILKNLVKEGMCDKARTLIPGLYIAFIGIDFDANEIEAFEQCVNNPQQDIIKVGNLADLIAKIEELIKNGSKSNGFTKLY
jgi:tight adherence protein G